MGTSFKLKVIEGPLAGREFVLGNRQTLSIGRRPGCDIALDDPAVSGCHCNLTLQEDRYLLEDLGSSNGTMLNGAEVREAVLQHRDLLVIGDSVIQVLDSERSPDSSASLVRDNWTQHDSDIVEKFRADVELSEIGRARPGVRRLRGALAACYELAAFISQVDRLDLHFERMLTIVNEAYCADRACLVLTGADGAEYDVVATVHRLVDEAPFEVSKTILDSCVREGNSILTTGGQPVAQLFAASDSLQGQQVKAVLCVPIRTPSGGRIGAVYLDSLTRMGFFDRDDLLLLTCLANLIGAALDRHRLAREAAVSRRQLEAMNEAMAAFIDRKGLERVSRILLDCCLAQTGSPSGFIAILREGEGLECLTRRDCFETHAELPFRIGEPGQVLQRVLETGEALLATRPPGGDADEEEEFTGEPETLLAVRLTGGGQAIGLVVLMNRPGGYGPAERDSLEALAGMAGVIYDSHLRELRESALQEQFRQSQKMEAIGRLAGGVAHDFNNMLTVINGYCDLMMLNLGPESELIPDLAEIRRCGQRSADLAMRLLALSRKQVVEPRVLDVGGVLADLDKMLRRLVGEHVELAVGIAPDLYPVFADLGQIEQIVLNLTVNARDAMPQGGRIEVTADNVELEAPDAALARGRYLRLTVQDTGGGIERETLPHIFEPFFTTKKVGEGTGLGLSTVYGIVQHCGGKIEVSSRLGEGARFEVLLPASDTVAEEVESLRPTDQAGGDEVILLVEDEDGVRRFASRVLSLHGYQVIEAARGDDALRIGAQRKGEIHLLLTDAVLPRVSGPEVARQLSAEDPDLRVMYMSAYPEAELAQYGFPAQGPRPLRKPFTPDELLCGVRRSLGPPGAKA